MAKAINRRIEGTDIYVFSRDGGNYTFFRPFELDEARQLADATNKIIADYGVKGLNGEVLGVDEERVEIFNMSTLRGILANKTLMHQTKGQGWLPTIGEGTHLQRAGLYRGGIIDHGLALYSAENPDSEVAQSLAEDAERRGIGAMPVFASFRDLDLQNGGERYGVIPQLTSTEGLYSGERAQELARDNGFELGNSGVRRLLRYGGDWGALWRDNLDDFYRGCRVGGFSAVGGEKILNGLVQKKIRQDHDSRKKALEAQLREQERATIESAETVLNA